MAIQHTGIDLSRRAGRLRLASVQNQLIEGGGGCRVKVGFVGLDVVRGNEYPDFSQHPILWVRFVDLDEFFVGGQHARGESERDGQDGGDMHDAGQLRVEVAETECQGEKAMMS